MAAARSAEFDAELAALAERHAPDPTAGFFGPGSATWLVDREMVLYLGGMRALLLQLAHPRVAQGVAEHSDFRTAPLGRALGTFRAVHRIVFGTREDALRAAARAYHVHTHVRGDGYDALDPPLLLWVHATLVDTVMYSHQLFLPPLPHATWARYYEESKVGARLFAVPQSALPPDLATFRRWFDGMLASDVIGVSPAGREVAKALLDGPAVMSLLRPLNYLGAGGMLPPHLRAAFGIPWGRAQQASFDAIVGAVRRIVPRAPHLLRVNPAARAAERRCAPRAAAPWRLARPRA
jgi:uncharacterized protein (DUF2236 family)